MTQELDIIVSGHLCLDLIPAMNHIPPEALLQAGRLLETGPMTISTGGSVSNTGLALNRLGVNVRLVSTVGDDLIGRVIVAFVKDRDPVLGETIRQKHGLPSSYTVVLSPQKSDRTFLHCPANNVTFGLEDVDFDLVARAKIFHLGYPPILPRLMANDGDELTAIFQKAHASGAVTSLDMSLPDPDGPAGRVNWRVLLEKTLPFVDIFLPSIEEILFMLRRVDFDRWHGAVLSHITQGYLRELADELLTMGVVIAGFKLGELGMYLQTGDDLSRLKKLGLDEAVWRNVEVYLPAFEVEVAGTTGAGDSAYAGFLTALLHRLPPEEALRFACAVGACNVEAPDATSGVRSFEETMQRLQAGWQARTHTLTA
ncbi:MAG: carbohydrate kinase family protein [bacterium]|nr:carbohydrate kinase family protein [bacterium]